MKKTELKKLAQKIANAELIIENSKNSTEVENAKATIIRLAETVTNLDDLMYLDELIQEYIS